MTGSASPTAAGTDEPPQHWLAPAPFAGPPRRHPWEIPLLIVVLLISAAVYGVVVWRVTVGELSTYYLLTLLAPLLIYLIRGLTFAAPRTSGVKMTSTQFPEGYQMVLEAARRYGLEFLPDAYVVLGNGTINAFASGHGFRRFIVVYSDLFEIGGRARNPEALRFIIGHEVGHIAAGHASYWRQLGISIGMYIPFVGTALSRAQEYTADNHGYYNQPSGSPGAIGVMAAGKYMLDSVDFDELADRATRETGFFVWLTNLLSTHPVLTWRAAALRNRTRPGRMFFRPSAIVRGIGSGHVRAVLPPIPPAVGMPGPPSPNFAAPGPFPTGAGPIPPDAAGPPVLEPPSFESPSMSKDTSEIPTWKPAADNDPADSSESDDADVDQDAEPGSPGPDDAGPDDAEPADSGADDTAGDDPDDGDPATEKPSD